MNPIQKEPAVTIGVAVGAMMGLLLAYDVVDTEKAAAWSAFLLVALPIIQGVFTRFHVFSPNTIREAGLDPAAVKERAEDPSIPRCEKGE